MTNKVAYSESSGLFFKNLKKGDLFNMPDHGAPGLYMKTDAQGKACCLQAVHLATGEVYDVLDYTAVVQINSCTITKE